MPASEKQLIENLQKVLEGYDEHFTIWLYSEACLLTNDEIKVIGYLLAFRRVDVAAGMCGMETYAFMHILSYVSEKLKRTIPIYRRWMLTQARCSEN